MIEEMRIIYNPEEICIDNRHSECKGKRNKICSCIEIVIAILSALFMGIIGVIIGALIAGLVFLALPAIIVLAIVLFILLVLSIIVAICCKSKRPKKPCCR